MITIQYMDPLEFAEFLADVCQVSIVRRSLLLLLLFPSLKLSMPIITIIKVCRGLGASYAGGTCSMWPSFEAEGSAKDRSSMNS